MAEGCDPPHRSASVAVRPWRVPSAPPRVASDPPRSPRADPPRRRVEVPPAGGHRVLRGSPGRPGDPRALGRVHVDHRRPGSPGGRRRATTRPPGRTARFPSASTRRSAAAPISPCLVWLHGGAFRMGDLDMPEADWTAREICERAGAVVVSVDYRLCVGGVTYPVPHEDTVAAVRWVRDNAAALGVDADRISLGGASAGGNLAAGATLRLRDDDGWCPANLLLAYTTLHAVVPPAVAVAGAAAGRRPAAAPVPAGGPPGITENYLGGPASRADGYAMPANAVLEGLCPVLLLNSEYDDLRASAEAFAGQLAVAGRGRPAGARPGDAARLPEPARRHRAGRRGTEPDGGGRRGRARPGPGVTPNPLLPGFNPDPSIVLADGAYYLVTSTFEYLPGLPVYRSTDLVEWTQIGNVATRPEQVDLEKVPTPGGVWAPTIRYRDGVFYVIVTVMLGGRGLRRLHRDRPGRPVERRHADPGGRRHRPRPGLGRRRHRVRHLRRLPARDPPGAGRPGDRRGAGGGPAAVVGHGSLRPRGAAPVPPRRRTGTCSSPRAAPTAATR